ncbi:sigma-54 dependent DNA-binding reponse regulator [Oscillochloris trichoides DG-6]|uniref:Sigma-54 dependent DNA-binding reponse regulator n=1 Tax=Oscillochloris trichoides DG-6 TaxID=765420 RepID=E1IBA0_9CHLR|nr:response regulator [Oscillochloris trichoides]EFO81585.1 sigma-54 dependent DNA-binding reponse regulator [Oscillochloris trichoides DG-6]
MRVLIVEDDAAVRTFLYRVLCILLPNAQIVSAVDGHQALLEFLAEPADLVISDHRMPNMTGLELLITLREHSSVPFIMISAEAATERRAMQAGASAYLAKPLTINDLRAVISHVLAISFDYTSRV